MFFIFDLLLTLTTVKTNFAMQRICSVVSHVVGALLPTVPSRLSPFKKRNRHYSGFKPAPTQISGSSAVSYIKKQGET